MAKQRRSESDEATPKRQPLTNYYDVQTLQQMAAKVAAEGFVPADALKEEFGPTKFTQGIAVLFRQFRMFREVTRPWGEGAEQARGYEWADRRFSTAEAKKIPGELGFLVEMGKGSRPKYADFEVVRVKCRWTNTVLGAMPSKDGEGDLHVFRRNEEESVLILAYRLRKMAMVALPMIGKEASVAYKIGFVTVVVTHPKIGVQVDPIIDERGQGLGLKRSETLPPGTEFTVEAMVPTSALSVADFVRMLAIAGKYVRLSPARHTAYGDFEVIS